MTPRKPKVEQVNAEITIASEVSAIEGDDVMGELELAATDGEITFVPAATENRTVVVAPIDGQHALDAAPANAKIVVVAEDGLSCAMFADTVTVTKLPAGDPAHKLPVGARIQKVKKGRTFEYHATQLGDVLGRPPLVTTSATDAIARFNQHFHDVK